MAGPKGPKPKHVPLRTCIGTGERHPKRDMARLVKTEEGHIVVDPTGKRSGSRGAYIVKRLDALEQAIKRKALEAEFEGPIPPGDLDVLRTYFSQF
ncbi:MAG: YlxR family protein [Thermoflexales bacterium]|nr:YlxR family protein [Thermoflexales bacterium]